MLTLEESRDEARKLAEAGYDMIVYHAPAERDDWGDDAHTYGYQPNTCTLAPWATVVEKFPATRQPAYKTATRAQIVAANCEAYGAETESDRKLVASVYARHRRTGENMNFILMTAEREHRAGGRLAEAAQCQRLLDHANQ
jgi:hypothetical protein